MEFGEWDEAREGSADVVDAIWKLIALVARGSTEDAPQTVRPDTLRERKKALAKSRRARQKIASTKWEEV